MTPALFATIWFVHLLAAISPGPAVLMAARTGLIEGAARGTALAVGLAAGACVWAAAAMFGLQALFLWAPGLLTVLRFAGAAYLFWLAFRMWRHAAEPFDAGTGAGGAPARPRSMRRLAWGGLTLQLSNPKPAVFFGAVFASLVPPHVGWTAATAVLAVVFANEFLWNALVSRVFSVERVRAVYVGLKGGIDRVFGGLMALLGIKLAIG